MFTVKIITQQSTQDNVRREYSAEYVAQLERRIAFLEARVEELAKMQPPAPVVIQVSEELRGVLIEHLKQMGVKSE